MNARSRHIECRDIEIVLSPQHLSPGKELAGSFRPITFHTEVPHSRGFLVKRLRTYLSVPPS